MMSCSSRAMRVRSSTTARSASTSCSCSSRAARSSAASARTPRSRSAKPASHTSAYRIGVTTRVPRVCRGSFATTIVTPPTAMASPIRSRTASTWLPSKNAAANPAANVPVVNVIRCPSTNDKAAARSSVAAGAANGYRRRANSGRIMSQSAGTASQVDKLGPPTSWRCVATSIALSIAATTMSTSKPNLRASNPSRCIRRTVPGRVVSNLLLEDEFRIRLQDERESHSRPTTPPGPVRTVRVAGSTGVSAGPRDVIVMKAKRIYTPTRIVALVVIGVMLFGLTYLRFAPGDAAISVRAGAKAGDLTMHACTYATEQGAMPADCGTLVVPENRASSKSRLIALPVTRVPSRSSAPAGPDLPAPGRPGCDQHDLPRCEPPGRPARCRHGRLPRRRRLFGAEVSRGDGGAGPLRGLPRQSVAEHVLQGLRLVRAAA